jgi:hypothetical protein
MHPVSPGSPSENPDPLATTTDPAPYRDAFLVADELAVHGNDCVCPPCAGRLTGLLSELARTIREGSTD